MRGEAKSEIVCPKCGSGEYYPNAYPTGQWDGACERLAVPRPDEGHCLSCDYCAEFNDAARLEARAN